MYNNLKYGHHDNLKYGHPIIIPVAYECREGASNYNIILQTTFCRITPVQTALYGKTTVNCVNDLSRRDKCIINIASDKMSRSSPYNPSFSRQKRY